MKPTIEVKSAIGCYDSVPAQRICGVWAAHEVISRRKNGDRWAVTHIPSGLRLATYALLSDAKSVCSLLGAVVPRVSHEEMLSNSSLRVLIPAIGQRR